jgi:hypothetical protein
MNRNEFLELVDKKVKEDPKLVGDVVKLCMGVWNAYLDFVRLHREAEHLNSITGAIHAASFHRKRLFNNVELPSLIDAVAFVFPRGFDSAACEADRRFLRLFVESAQKLGWEPESVFIRDIREFDGLLSLLYKQREDECKSDS